MSMMVIIGLFVSMMVIIGLFGFCTGNSVQMLNDSYYWPN